jgi:hypothetical protein
MHNKLRISLLKTRNPDRSRPVAASSAHLHTPDIRLQTSEARLGAMQVADSAHLNLVDATQEPHTRALN